MWRRTALFCQLLAGIVQSGCSPPPPPGNFHLATVAASPEHQMLFIAQPGLNAVDVLRMAADRRNEAPAFVARLVDPQRTHVLRLAVDHRQARLWVADFKLVQVYALPDLREVRRYELHGDVYYNRFTDLALDDAGNVFVLAQGGARIDRIDATSLDLETWLQLHDRATDAALALANRALTSRSGDRLYLASATRGDLVQIDLRSKQVTLVSENAANFTCGLLFWDGDSTNIRAFDCTGRWEAHVNLAQSGLASPVVLRGEPRQAGSITIFADRKR